ncbi:hypothetical protein ACEWY4_014095 [Coilia grayii]|uniref:E3 ubiquitin-protein ligase RNF166 n=1 Tax=Coilia grayii TaxID=363190 RepID=A0ABD1JRB9_9TELE
MDADEKQCPVCFGELRDPTRLSDCAHEFCHRCISECIKWRRHCPVCRTAVNGDLVTAVPSQTRRLRVSRGRSRHSMGFPFIESLVVPSLPVAIQNPILDQARSANPSSTLPPNPLRAAEPAPTGWPLPLLFSSWSPPQVTGAVGPVHVRPPQGHAAPQLDVYGPLDLSILTAENDVRVFECPYCHQGGLDDLALRDHCNSQHRNDPTPVVCPVCVSLPHGNENYYSRNFIGHLNMRHSYYIHNVTDIHQSDDLNMQKAILESFRPFQ